MPKTVEFSHISEITVEFDEAGRLSNIRCRLSLKDQDGSPAGYEFVNLPLREMLLSKELGHQVDEVTGHVYDTISGKQVATYDRIEDIFHEPLKAVVARARQETGY